MNPDLLGQIVISALQFSTIVLLIWALFRHPVDPEPPVNRRIALALGLGSRDTVFEAPIIGQLLGYMVLLARRFPFFRDTIRQDLDASGNPNNYSVEEYLALSLGCAVLMGAVAIVLMGQLGQVDLLLLLAGPPVGFALPLMVLHSQADRRTRYIAKKLPYTLDLIALLMEAGGTFPEAIETLIRDDPDDEFNREMKLVQSEIELGTTRASALRNLGERIPLDSLRSVVGAINQSEALGTPLSVILKNQSNMIRMLRSVRAEEASATASVRILMPGVLILLAVVLVVFSPMIMRWMEGNLMAG